MNLFRLRAGACRLTVHMYIQNPRPGSAPLESSISLPDRAELFSVVGPDGALPSDAPCVVACAEEVGGTNALGPVLRQLHGRSIGATVLAAGNGLRILQERGYEHGLRLQGPLAAWPEAALCPGALLISPSEDGRLEEYLFARFRSTPAVVVEDYYESGRRAVACAASMELVLPTVCVVDGEAERLIRRRFRNVPVPVEVTGSPTFDALAGEDFAAVQERAKKELGVPPEQKFVTFLIPRLGERSLLLAGRVARAFQRMGPEYLFTARRHPSDTIEAAAYGRLFQVASMLDTAALPTDKVADAADLVIAHRSVTVLREVMRQHPTITLAQHLDPDFTFPLVDAGASVAARPAELPEIIPELLAGTSPRCRALRRNMERYRPDGGAAARVADVVCRAMDLAG